VGARISAPIRTRPSPLCSGYWISFQGVKQPGCGVDHLPTSDTEVKERIELYLFAAPCLHGLILGELIYLTFVVIEVNVYFSR